MNVNDGTINDTRSVKCATDFIEVNKNDMTETQKRDRRVSLHDHRSKLGKKLTSERQKRKLRKNKF